MAQFITILITIALGALAVYLVRRTIRSQFLNSRLPPRFLPLIESSLRWLVVTVTLIVLMRMMGVTASTVIASISAFSLVAAVAFFAYWSVLSNGFCSLLLLLFQPFRVGDRIEVREHANNIVAIGIVKGINLLYISLSHTDSEGIETLFRIPANLLFQRTIRVWQGDNTKSLGLAYAEDNLKVQTKEAID